MPATCICRTAHVYAYVCRIHTACLRHARRAYAAYVYAHTNVYACTCVHCFVHTACLRCAYVCRIRICIHRYIHACVHICIRACRSWPRGACFADIQTDRHAYIRTYRQTDIHTYIHTYIHTHIHTYIHTYTHTHTHTYAYLRVLVSGGRKYFESTPVDNSRLLQKTFQINE